MAESLKKGIGAKYLFPVLTAYAGIATLAGNSFALDLQTMLQRFGIAGVSGLVILVIQDLLPRPVKEVLIFWRLRDRLPGCRAFSHHTKRDPRIDQAALAKLLPSTTMTPVEQNALWYQWLKSVESDPAIAENHHRVLALRDSAVLLLMLGVISPFMIVTPDQSWKGIAILCAVCLTAYVLTRFAACNAAVRLVGNVIARKLTGANRSARPAPAKPRRPRRPDPLQE